MADFDGRVVIVTAGASFVGEAIAADLVEGGAHVVLADRDADHGAEVADQSRRTGVVRRDGRHER